MQELTHIEAACLKKLANEVAEANQSLSELHPASEQRLYRWLNYLSGAYSPREAYAERVAFKVCIDNNMVGFIAGHLTSRYGKDAEIQSLHTIADDNDRARKKLLLRFIQWATAQGAVSLCVGVGPIRDGYEDFLHDCRARFLNSHWAYWDDLSALADRLEAPRHTRVM